MQSLGSASDKAFSVICSAMGLFCAADLTTSMICQSQLALTLKIYLCRLPLLNSKKILCFYNITAHQFGECQKSDLLTQNNYRTYGLLRVPAPTEGM